MASSLALIYCAELKAALITIFVCNVIGVPSNDKQTENHHPVGVSMSPKELFSLVVAYCFGFLARNSAFIT